MKIVLLIAAIIAIVACLGYLAYSDNRQWERFKIDHHCVEAGKMRGGVGTGVSVSPSDGSVGVVTTWEHDKTGWRCDDGKIYWR